jgi:hypothetical protein
MVELILKDHIGLETQAIHCASFPCSGEGNLTINKISGDKYLQYNDTYLNIVWAKELEIINFRKTI